jgi:hypothetical protein
MRYTPAGSTARWSMLPRSGDASVVQQEHFLAYQRGQRATPWVQITLAPATGCLPGHGDAEHRRDRVG